MKYRVVLFERFVDPSGVTTDSVTAENPEEAAQKALEDGDHDVAIVLTPTSHQIFERAQPPRGEWSIKRVVE